MVGLVENCVFQRVIALPQRVQLPPSSSPEELSVFPIHPSQSRAGVALEEGGEDSTFVLNCCRLHSRLIALLKTLHFSAKLIVTRKYVFLMLGFYSWKSSFKKKNNASGKMPSILLLLWSAMNSRWFGMRSNLLVNTPLTFLIFFYSGGEAIARIFNDFCLKTEIVCLGMCLIYFECINKSEFNCWI